MLGLSLEDLARATGVTYQQMQKYEKGVNRISASRLYVLARLLDGPVGYFYEGLDDTQYADAAASADSDPLMPAASMSQREGLEAMRAYSALECEIRRAFMSLMKAVSEK